ncbi:DinB family protein [Deinococcus roseus]|uniref:Damage-inducible protein DinB n=1 Tax=Deinococcus roseus TaxID=392414 RepID=A0ABQ2D7J6_9DEIO|nr:DinB family protein [Deinococcus roseus]GGJ48963.1 hypothetical protein GCM10008938_38670 [Deinococcus roseus]
MHDYVETILKLAEYELWTNLQLLDAVADLPESDLHRDFGFGLRTPHHTLFHIANVMRTWSACVGTEIRKPEPLPYDPSLSLEDLRSMFLQLGADWQKAIQQSHDQGVLNENRRLHQVFHLVTHGTHHRGQLLSMFTLLGLEQPIEGGDFGGWSNQTGEA